VQSDGTSNLGASREETQGEMEHNSHDEREGFVARRRLPQVRVPMQTTYFRVEKSYIS